MRTPEKRTIILNFSTNRNFIKPAHTHFGSVSQYKNVFLFRVLIFFEIYFTWIVTDLFNLSTERVFEVKCDRLVGRHATIHLCERFGCFRVAPRHENQEKEYGEKVATVKVGWFWFPFVLSLGGPFKILRCKLSRAKWSVLCTPCILIDAPKIDSWVVVFFEKVMKNKSTV